MELRRRRTSPSATLLCDLPEEILHNIFSRLSLPLLHVFRLRALCSRFRSALSDYWSTSPAFLISFKETLKTERGDEEEAVYHAVCDEEWNLHKVHQFRGLSHTVLAVGNGVYWVSVTDADRAVKWYVLSPTCPSFQSEIRLLENHTPEDFYAAYIDDEMGCFGLIRVSKENPEGHIDMYSSDSRAWSSFESPEVAESMLLHRHTNTQSDREMDRNSANSRSSDWGRALSSRRAVFCNGRLFWTYAQCERGLCLFRVGVFTVWDRSFASVSMPEDFRGFMDFFRPIFALIMPGLLALHFGVDDLSAEFPECWSLTGCKGNVVLLEEWSGKAWNLCRSSDDGDDNREDEDPEESSPWSWELAWELHDKAFYDTKFPCPGVSSSFARFHATNGNEWMICRVPGMNIPSLPPRKFLCVKDFEGKNVCSFFKSHVMNVLNPSNPRNVSIEGIWAIECNSLPL